MAAMTPEQKKAATTKAMWEKAIAANPDKWNAAVAANPKAQAAVDSHMTSEQIKKAQNKVKWDKLQAERQDHTDEREAARATMGNDYKGSMYGVKDGDKTRYYKTSEEMLAAQNPYKNQMFAGTTGSDADIWNINNGWERTAKDNKNEYTGGDSTLQPSHGADGTGSYGSNTSGMFNNITRDTLFEYENKIYDEKNAATAAEATKKARWEEALGNNPEFGPQLLEWAKANPGQEGAGDIILAAQEQGMTTVGGQTVPSTQVMPNGGEQWNGEGMLGNAAPAPTYSYSDVVTQINSGEPVNWNAETQAYDNAMTRAQLDAYIGGMGKEAETSPTEFFNVVHSLFATDPEAFNQWKRDNPAMALRFHALAGSGQMDSQENFGTNDQFVDWANSESSDNVTRIWGEESGTWNHQKHRDWAQHLGQQITKEQWGDETEVDGSMIASDYSGNYSKDVNNPMSGGDFWKIGTSQKESDGVMNFVEENPAMVAVMVGGVALAGPIIGAAATTTAGGTAVAATGLTGTMAGLGVPAAYAGYAAAGVYATGVQIASGAVSGQELDADFLLNAVGTGVLTAVTAGAIQMGGNEIMNMFPSVPEGVANQITSVALETASNGGDLEQAIYDGLIAEGVNVVKGAVTSVASSIGNYFAADAPASITDGVPDWVAPESGEVLSLNGPSGLEEFDIFSDTVSLPPLGADTFEGNIQGMTDYNAEDVGKFEQNLTSLEESGYPIVDQHGDELSISGDYVKNQDDDTWIRLEDANGGDGDGGNGGDGDGGNNGTGSNGNGGEGDGGMFGEGGVGEGGVGGTGTPPPTDAEWQDTLGEIEAQGMPTTDGAGNPLSRGVEYDLMDNADGSQDWIAKGGVSQDQFEANMSELAAAGHPTTDTSGEPLRNDGTAYEMDSNGGFVDPTKGAGGMFAEFNPEVGIEIGTTPEDITGDGALAPTMGEITIGNGKPVEGGPDSWETHVEAASTTSSTGVVEFTLSTGESSVEIGGFVEVATPDLVVVEEFLGPEKLAEAVYVGETMEYTGEMVSEYSLDGTNFTIAGLSGIIRDTYGYVPNAEYDPEAPSPTKPPDDVPKEDFEAPIEETPPEEEPAEEEEEEEEETLVNGVVGGLPSADGNNNYNGVTDPYYPTTPNVNTPVSNPVGTPVGGPNGGSNGGGGGGGGLGSASALIGGGLEAAQAGNLFDFTKLSPSAYAILAPLLDQMEHLQS